LIKNDYFPLPVGLLMATDNFYCEVRGEFLNMQIDLMLKLLNHGLPTRFCGLVCELRLEK
jgi:hypothetical protein